jgi:hypothetical protein
MIVDNFTLLGILSVAAVIALLYGICKLKGCNKPYC